MKSGQESPAGEKGSMLEAVKMSSEFLMVHAIRTGSNRYLARFQQKCGIVEVFVVRQA